VHTILWMMGRYVCKVCTYHHIIISYRNLVPLGLIDYHVSEISDFSLGDLNKWFAQRFRHSPEFSSSKFL
jgi:hypothetical protein